MLSEQWPRFARAAFFPKDAQTFVLQHKGQVTVRYLGLCANAHRGKVRIIAFLTDYAVVDRVIHHVRLTFVAAKPPPSHIACQEFLMAAETAVEYLS